MVPRALATEFGSLGLLAGLVRSELKLPPALYDTLSLFLLLAVAAGGLAAAPLWPPLAGEVSGTVQWQALAGAPPVALVLPRSFLSIASGPFWDPSIR